MTTAPALRPLDALAGDYARHAKRLPVSEHTVRSYVYAVTGFAAWLAEQTKHAYEEVVTDELVATHAVRDYRRYLLTERKLAPKSVDTALTGIGSLYAWLGMSRPDVSLAAGKRRGDPKALDEEQSRDVLRAAERRGIRDHALVMLMYAAGPRVSETAALDADDVPVSERKGLVIIRGGKGDKPREVDLNYQASQVLGRWLRVRRDDYGMPAESGPLFVTRTNERLAVRSIRHVITQTGRTAGVELAPHTLRHTFGTRLARSGVDLPVIADLMGHADVNTTMVYARSNGRDRAEAVERMTLDY